MSHDHTFNFLFASAVGESCWASYLSPQGVLLVFVCLFVCLFGVCLLFYIVGIFLLLGLGSVLSSIERNDITW